MNIKHIIISTPAFILRTSKILSLPALALSHPFTALYREMKQYQQVKYGPQFSLDIQGAKLKQNSKTRPTSERRHSSIKLPA